MTRLLLATALVLHLSGFSAVAAVVSMPPGMTAASCCCHHAAGANGRATQVGTTPSCPCRMSPGVPAPATPMPATPASSGNVIPALAVFSGIGIPILPVSPLAAHILATGDASPPYLTAAHPRC